MHAMVRRPLDDQRHGSGQQRTREQGEARDRQARQRAPLGLGDPSHRRCERSAGPDHVRPEPESVDRVASDVRVVVQPVDLVGDDPERDAHEQEAIGGGATAGADEQLRQRDQEQHVHGRVRHRHEPRAFRPELPVVVGIDEEHPLHERDAAEDDHGVEDRRAARLAAELAQQDEDAECEQRIPRQVEDIGDRRRRRLAVELDLVDGEDRVAGDLAEQPEREQVPGQPIARWQVEPRAEVDRDHRRQPDRDEEDGLRVRRQQEVDADRHGAGADERPAERRGAQTSGQGRQAAPGQGRRSHPEDLRHRPYSTLRGGPESAWLFPRMSLHSRQFP